MEGLERTVSSGDIRRQSRLISEKRIGEIVSEYADDFVGVMNSSRQFVMLNAEYFGNAEVIKNLLGERPGSIFNCVHSHDVDAGCGFSPSCGYCGAVDTIREAIVSNRRVSRDGRIMIENNETMNVRITAIPIDVETEIFVLLFLKDTGKEERILFLERAFFHEVLNSSTSLKSLVALSEVRSRFVPEADKSIEMGVNDIVEQIQYFQRLKMAEDGELEVELAPVNLAAELRQLTTGLYRTPFGEGKTVRLILPHIESVCITDRFLFRRIVLNLLRNALEASNMGETVELELAGDMGEWRLYVRNRTVISDEVRHQIFQRFFSTRGPGRGVGTYATKLLSEKYLGGRVSFSSEEGEGTIFVVELPGR